MANLPDVSGASAAQTAAARGLVTALLADTSRYRDAAVATEAGYDVQAALKQVVQEARRQAAGPDRRPARAAAAGAQRTTGWSTRRRPRR